MHWNKYKIRKLYLYIFFYYNIFQVADFFFEVASSCTWIEKEIKV